MCVYIRHTHTSTHIHPHICVYPYTYILINILSLSLSDICPTIGDLGPRERGGMGMEVEGVPKTWPPSTPADGRAPRVLLHDEEGHKQCPLFEEDESYFVGVVQWDCQLCSFLIPFFLNFSLNLTTGVLLGSLRVGYFVVWVGEIIQQKQ